jgi:exonuclease SbcC
MREEWQENKEQLKKVTEQIESTRHRLDRLTIELERFPALQRREAELAQRLADAEEANAQIGDVQSNLTQIKAKLEQGDYAPELRSPLTEIQAKLSSLAYDSDAHRQVREEIEKMAAFESRFTYLTQAQEEITAAREAVTRLQERQDRWSRALTDDRHTRTTLLAEIEQLNEQLIDADQVETEVNALRQQESDARMRLGAARQRLDACQALKTQRDERQAELTQHAEEQAFYEELRVAFGKKGVPAMIIEAAIPDIEESANALLARMTNGRMHVRFETQREKVTGGVAETLDIQISDALGTRNYELYSGGEAFRINFAIRIALSKLLARRAGARLRTLVIDEGFGTQDAAGRERLIEAINAIQSDFARVIVITHIDELKDVFPARIQVTKTPTGSQIEVM